MRPALQRYLPAVKAAVSPGAPMGLGLRLSAAAARRLQHPEAFDELLKLLGDEFYVFTLNGFPYGTFHREPVKENVYRPDWRSSERLSYSNQLADLLARVQPEGGYASISTLPGSFRPWLEQARGGPERARQIIADQLIAHAAHLHEIRRTTGREICLALEPEPFCMLETTADTLAFFDTYLHSPPAISAMAGATGSNAAEAERSLRRHLGVCLDVCHQAVMFEDPLTCVDSLQAAGVRIAKLQLSAALKLAPVDVAALAELAEFNNSVYLHQTVVKDGAGLQYYLDLDQALVNGARGAELEWRSHFHVPLFLDRLEHFSTTQDELLRLLERHRSAPICEHLEVETYTWDVLPPRYRQEELADAIALELNWVVRQFQ